MCTWMLSAGQDASAPGAHTDQPKGHSLLQRHEPKILASHSGESPVRMYLREDWQGACLASSMTLSISKCCDRYECLTNMAQRAER